VTMELTVQVIGEESTDPRRLDEMGRQLAQDLRSAAALSVRPIEVQPPPLSKSGTAQQIGYLVVSGLLSASTVGAIRDVIVAYLARSRARAVRVKAGDREVTLDGASKDDLAAVSKQLRELIQGDRE
jgi:Effector Associated Constant Component 1